VLLKAAAQGKVERISARNLKHFQALATGELAAILSVP